MSPEDNTSTAGGGHLTVTLNKPRGEVKVPEVENILASVKL